MTPDLPIQLKPIALIRDYQEKSLSKMFGNGRARSGIIVLPCGAGKSLVGITAMTTIHKSTLIFCNTGVSVEQWKGQVEKWTNLPPKYIACFTATTKDRIQTDALVLITTYNMVSFAGQRSAEAERAMDFITKQEWGLIIMDEVHVAPAKMFRKCFGTDTRVLTNRGFLFVDEIEALPASQASALLYAAFDSSTQQLVYRPGQLVFPPNTSGRLLSFTSAGESHRWSDRSGEHGTEDKSDSDEDSNQLSLRVTPDHDMFVELGNLRSSDDMVSRRHDGNGATTKPMAKYPAGELSSLGYDSLRMLGVVSGGVNRTESEHQEWKQHIADALDLTTADQRDAFLELYGQCSRTNTADTDGAAVG